MRIEPATLEDCRAVAQVHVTSWQHAYRRLLPATFLDALSVERRQEMWSEALATGAVQLYVARGDQGIAGFIAFGACRDEDAPPRRAEVWALYLAPSSWSQGVGRGLWTTARDCLVAQGHETVSLWVLAGNERAIRFYRAAGFQAEPQAVRAFELAGVPLQEVRYWSTVKGDVLARGIPA